MPASSNHKSRKLRALYQQVQDALSADDISGALTAYASLENLDSTNPEWARQLATLHGRRGDIDQELDALVRCADRHAKRKEFIPALATYKMILSTDPGHVVAQQRLSELQPQSSTISVDYGGEARSDSLQRGPEAGHSFPTDSAPLDELVLTDIVQGAQAIALGDDTEGIHEIPLELPIDDVSPEDLAHLEQTPLFSSLDRQSLTKLVQQIQLVELRSGEELFHQGDPAGALYVIARGAVVPIAEEGSRKRLAVLEAGEFFGEIALFTNQPRNATIEALVDTQLLCIDRGVMWRLVQEHAQVLSVLLQFLRERLIQRLIRTSPVFQIFSESKRSAIVRRFRFLEVSDGHAVIEQHRPAEAVFILLSGQMEVVHREDGPNGARGEGPEKILASLEAGELVGEMSLLWREPSLASVIARGKCWLLALASDSFREMLDHHPELAELASRLANERREQNRSTLRDALGHRDGTAGLI